MDKVSAIREQVGSEWLPLIYREKVRTQRTRSVTLDVPARENSISILHTLLGIELKIGNKRFPCPDLSMARYMLVFARAGCRDFAVPYDITRISVIADELETSWQKMMLLLESKCSGRSVQATSRIRNLLVKAIRTEIAEAGPGELMPTFAKSTRQR